MLNNENIPSFEVDGETQQPEVSAGIQVGIENHQELKGRALPDQHPISAITGLQEALDSKAEAGEFVTKDELDKKQDTITDLAEIREGAGLGATAVQPRELDEYATKQELSGKQDKGDYALKSEIPKKVSALENDAGYLTEHQDISGLATKQELAGKQDFISDLPAIRSGSALGETAVQPSELDEYATKQELNGKQDTIPDLSEIRQGASKGETAVQPAAIANMATTDTAQDITETKTFKTQQKLQYGGSDSCLIIGADVGGNTVTANTRKLGRMGFHTNESTTLNCAFVSTDTQDAISTLDIKNCVEFGGRPADTTSTSPDIMNFTVAKIHNTTALADKILALSIDKNGADFAVPPKYNGVNLQTESTIQTLSATDSITLTDGYIYNGGEQTALTIALPTTDSVGFICEVDFTSPATATTLSYSLPDIFWEGTDVAYDSTAQKNIFTPVANKRYTIIFYFDGVNYNGRVGGV